MDISRKVEIYNKNYKTYRVIYSSENKVFLKDNGGYLDYSVSGFDLINEDYLNNNNIKYIKDNDKIVPIGIVDFQNTYKMGSYELIITFDERDELYKALDVINSVELAIKIKSRYLDFINEMNKNKDTRLETTK